MTIAIRVASADDAPAVDALCARYFPGDGTKLAAELAREDRRVWVAEDAGAVVGFLYAQVVYDEIHLHLVAVAEEAAGRGVGGALLAAFLTPAMPRPLACARLEVRPSNRAALALYRRAGFRIVNTRRRYYVDGEDAFEMALPFADGTPRPLPADDP